MAESSCEPRYDCLYPCARHQLQFRQRLGVARAVPLQLVQLACSPQPRRVTPLSVLAAQAVQPQQRREPGCSNDSCIYTRDPYFDYCTPLL